MGPRPDAVALLPHEPGVYRFRDARGRALYLGRAGDLRSRVGSYWGDLRDRRHLRRMIPQIAAIEALVLASEHEAAWAERMLLEHRKGRWNRIAGGLETPVYVRVECAVPRIAVVHEVVEAPEVRWYGPYLGGTSTRLGVAGLERVYPMSYARSRLTGTERDLARLQGVDAADADAMVAAVDAVLGRDPAAVASARAALIAKRGAAASSELYEMARRVHEELSGLEWLVAPVRLFRAEDVTGRADGMQVTLGFRAGRLRTWEAAACPPDPKTPPATPSIHPPKTLPSSDPAWADSMHRNASLAAALAAHPIH